MSLRGILGVDLGYFCLDGGAARAQLGKVSLFSDFTKGRPTAFLLKIYKACSFYIICSNIRSLCVDSTYLFTCHITSSNCIWVIVWGVCTGRIVQEFASSRIGREVASSRIGRKVAKWRIVASKRIYVRELVSHNGNNFTIKLSVLYIYLLVWIVYVFTFLKNLTQCLVVVGIPTTIY